MKEHYFGSGFRHLLTGARLLFHVFNASFACGTISLLFVCVASRAVAGTSIKTCLRRNTFKFRKAMADFKQPVGIIQEQEGIGVKRTNGRFMWALSLYH